MMTTVLFSLWRQEPTSLARIPIKSDYITPPSFSYVSSAFSDLTTFSTSTVLSSLSLSMLSSTALIMSNDSFRNIDKRLLLLLIVC